MTTLQLCQLFKLAQFSQIKEKIKNALQASTNLDPNRLMLALKLLLSKGVRIKSEAQAHLTWSQRRALRSSKSEDQAKKLHRCPKALILRKLATNWTKVGIPQPHNNSEDANRRKSKPKSTPLEEVDLLTRRMWATSKNMIRRQTLLKPTCTINNSMPETEIITRGRSSSPNTIISWVKTSLDSLKSLVVIMTKTRHFTRQASDTQSRRQEWCLHLGSNLTTNLHMERLPPNYCTNRPHSWLCHL